MKRVEKPFCIHGGEQEELTASLVTRFGVSHSLAAIPVEELQLGVAGAVVR